MSLVRTSKGTLIDMAALATKNKKIVAVSGGGVSMNAQGDILGKGGKVIRSRKDLEAAYAAYTEANPQGATQVNIRSKNITPDKFKNRRAPTEENEKVVLELDDVTNMLNGKVPESPKPEEPIEDNDSEDESRDEEIAKKSRKRKTVEEE